MHRLHAWILKSPLRPLAKSAVGRATYGAIWAAAHRCGVARGQPPHCYKQRLVKRYGRRYRLAYLVETGTWRGDMLHAAMGWFSNLDSIELDPALYRAACARFASKPNIHIHLGDSAVLLPQILQGLAEPALFWLDAHFSGPGTSGQDQNPILMEVESVLHDDRNDHVLLIDDARLFQGSGGYPTLAKLASMLRDNRPDLKMSVDADVIRIEPREG
jgi:hypothetical protein